MSNTLILSPILKLTFLICAYKRVFVLVCIKTCKPLRTFRVTSLDILNWFYIGRWSSLISIAIITRKN